MESETHAMPGSDTAVDDQVIDVKVLEGRPSGREAAADAIDACAAIFTVVAAVLGTGADRRAMDVRDRVLVPQITVNDVVGAAGRVRNQSLHAVAGACGTVADRMRSAQQVLQSRADGRS